MNTIEFNQYEKNIHRLGFWSTLIMIIALVCVPLLTQLAFDLDVKGAETFKVLVMALAVFAPVAICEFISYVPLLGAGGLYIAFVTGNVMNMKLPAATNAQKICGVEQGTAEAEAISTLAAAVSTITTTIILIIGMIGMVQILPFLDTPFFKPGFDNVTAAIFAAIALPAFVKALKSSAVPVAVSAILTIALSYQVLCAGTRQVIVLPAMLVFAVLWQYVLYKKGQK